MVINKEINFLMISEAIQEVKIGNESKMGIIAPVVLWLVPFLPTQISFSVAVGIRTNVEQDVSIRIDVTSPSGIILNTFDANLEIPPFKQMAAILTGFDVKNMEVHEVGEYSANGYLDGEHTFTHKFVLVEKEKDNG
jgi:hypothetical protein